MRILIIHNKYGKFSGEEAVVESQIKLLRANGHEVITYFRSSEELETMPNSKLKAFASGIYNPNSIKDVKELIDKESPDLVHIHNLYPLISPAILPVIKKMGIPIAMTVHNYRLLCPNGLFFNKGEICEKCTGLGKEINCITNNCEDSLFKSTGYAMRNFWARTKKYYLDNIDTYLCLSTLQYKKLIDNGFEKKKLLIIPNSYGGDLTQKVEYKHGKYIGYVGRISPEKGSEIILELAEKLPNIKFKIAGANNNSAVLDNLLENVEYVGFLNKKQLSEFYLDSKFTLFTSVWNETFGLSIIEAFAQKKPVIASHLGASPEIIEDNKTGLIYQSKDLNDLTTKVECLYFDKLKTKEMGENAYLKLKEKYTDKVYYQKLISVYNRLQKKQTPFL